MSPMADNRSATLRNDHYDQSRPPITVISTIYYGHFDHRLRKVAKSGRLRVVICGRFAP
ncbi:MAG: hypothetical protein ACOX44_17485 [Limnochordia bacterium]